ncbi:MAG: oligosaccharide repeat unit polymerase [bacterium]|nr:oligosaccharide repeat unit polymerase [bacterium]
MEIWYSLVLSTIPLIIYTYVSWRKDNFNLLHPMFFPMVYWFLYYGLPPISGTYLFKERITRDPICLACIGILSYLTGFGLYKLRNRKIIIRVPEVICLSQQPIMMKMIFLSGVVLLIGYGIWSKVPVNLLSGQNIEGLRRVAEIGKGIIKEPGTFFTTVSAIWLWVFNIRYPIKKYAYFLLLPFTIMLIFIVSGHKASALFIVILFIGIYNKYRKVSAVKIAIVGFILLVAIGLLDAFRQGEPIDFIAIHRGINRFTAVYFVNYTPLIKLINNRYLDFQWGREYIQNAMILIPRFLLPTKPLCFDYFIKEQLNLNFLGGGAPPTPIGSLYINFGWWGVIIGMCLIGYLYGLIYGNFLTEKDLIKSILYIYILTYLIEPSLLIGRILLIFIFYLIIFTIDKICTNAALRNKPMLS